jgi:hypothetical protein
MRAVARYVGAIHRGGRGSPPGRRKPGQLTVPELMLTGWRAAQPVPPDRAGWAEPDVDLRQGGENPVS